MMLRQRKILGLAMEERGILAAEVQLSGRRTELRRAAEFVYPDGISLDDPQCLGRALSRFLGEHGFSARSTVIGIPARWLLSKEKGFPPAGASALAGMVRLEAERSFATDLDHLMMDYANGPASGQGAHLLMMAVTRQKADQLLAMSRAAGLRPASSSLMLFLRPDHVELVIRCGGHFQAIRHLSVALPAVAGATAKSSAAWSQAAVAEVRRLAALLPRTEGVPMPEELVVWAGARLDAQALQGLGGPLSLRTELSNGLDELGIAPSSSDEEADGHRFAAAAALARAGARGDGLPMDFLHSRLEVRRKAGPSRMVGWAAVIAVAFLVICGVLLADWRKEERDLAALRERLDAMKADTEAARRVVERVTFARGWYEQRPKFLDCLRELTLTFPSEGRIWVTGLAIREDMRVVVSGKASDERTVLDTLDRMRNGPTFTDVKLLYMREAAGAAREIAFSVTFGFVDGK
jgi:hypothetical protein